MLTAVLLVAVPAQRAAADELGELRLRTAAAVMTRAELDVARAAQRSVAGEMAEWDAASAFIDKVEATRDEIRSVADALATARSAMDAARTVESLFAVEVTVASARGRLAVLRSPAEVLDLTTAEVQDALRSEARLHHDAANEARAALGARPTSEASDLAAFYAFAAMHDHLEAVARFVTRRLGGDPVELAGVWAQTDSRRLAAVMTGLAQWGKPYVFASGGPNAFDCSGFTTFAWRAGGATITSYSYAQKDETQPLSMRAPNLRPGDLVFWDRGWSEEKQRRDGHVAMSLGYQNLVVEAHGSGSVRLSRYTTPYLSGFGRVTLRGEI
jgi:peptidoglycan DL-endopeptidase CwlO